MGCIFVHVCCEKSDSQDSNTTDIDKNQTCYSQTALVELTASQSLLHSNRDKQTPLLSTFHPTIRSTTHSNGSRILIYTGGGVPGIALDALHVDAPAHTGVHVNGYESIHGKLRWGCHSRAGKDALSRRKENQDTFCICDGLAENGTLFLLLDGHGPQGAYVSQYVRDQYCQCILQLLNDEQSIALSDIFFKTCEIVSERLRNATHIDTNISGTTATAALVLPQQYIFANIGDSRSVLAELHQSAYRICFETQDHKPDLPIEKQRIEECNGRVFEWGAFRVWVQDYDMPGLAMSRSFGDAIATSVGVTSKPDVTRVRRLEYQSSRDKGDPISVLVLASDGVWEFMTSEECVMYIGTCVISYEMTAQATCDALIAEATQRWENEENVVDDITAIVVFLI